MIGTMSQMSEMSTAYKFKPIKPVERTMCCHKNRYNYKSVSSGVEYSTTAYTLYKETVIKVTNSWKVVTFQADYKKIKMMNAS